MYKVGFLTIDEQIAHLKNVGVNVTSELKVKKILSKDSYYNIINGYNEPFLFQKAPKKYLKNVDFMELYALYDFDNKIRNIIFPYLLESENILKSEIIYAFSSCRDKTGNLLRKNDDYLKIKHYDHHNLNAAMIVISDFQKIISKYLMRSEAVSHYITQYSYVPLWVLAQYMTFGDISKCYCVLAEQSSNGIKNL